LPDTSAMEILVIPVIAFLVAILTFFSGFGLGTILAPAFMFFFPVELAIALTGLVHFANNVFKLFLVAGNANKYVLIRFGIPSVLGAVLGSWMLMYISGWEALFTYELFDKSFEVLPVKFIIALLLIIFSAMDIIPALGKMQFGKDKLIFGGVLSGFFGGLSGMQGALRSAFLIKLGLSKEAFVGTAVVVSAFVDFTRLSMYATKFSAHVIEENYLILLITSLSAIAGAWLGNLLLKKITLKFLQLSVAFFLLIIAIALGAGLI